ncbi:MAG: HAD-IA family hydrolase [Aquificaceae bacterium]|nr:HAD-IA family hydrolase [Aquificaceae bacterium]MCS7278363.1 HAD-IA family hydrolase [Aquificaceae bacterium]MDW8067270.1 HAD-IA family hydrolase [Aquificaceae bacterium]MDW8423220.1 HAD-IA family hydrolase [Aquificaceae bacterium]
MKKGIVFDVDGVIADVSESYHYAIKHTAEHFLGKEVPIEEVRRIKFLRGINNDWIATLEVIREYGGDASLDDIIQVFNSFYKSLRDKERLLLDRGFFQRLKEMGYSLGIVTGRPREDLLYLFQKHELSPFFDAFVDEDTIPQEELRKPHPYALHLCVESLGIDAGVYVGDSLADWQMYKDYRKIYAKPFEYVHVGERVVPEGAILSSPEGLFEALQEALRSL